MGKAWDLIQDWVDQQAIKDIKDAQLARLLGFSQSNFPTWQNPKAMPPRETIGVIADKINVPFEVLRDAFLDDLGYNKAPTAEEIEKAIQFRKGRSAGRARRAEMDAQGEAPDADGPEFGA